MKKITLLCWIFLLISCPTIAQQKDQPTDEQLKAITERGRILKEYVIATNASDQALAKEIPQGEKLPPCVPQKKGEKFQFTCGYLSKKKDKFYVLYEATEENSPQKFKVTRYDPPKEDTGYFFTAARALDLAYRDVRRKNFFSALKESGMIISPDGKPFPPSPMNYSVYLLPASNEQFWTCILPYVPSQDLIVLGWDSRYLISKDGKKVLEKRYLHKGGYAISTSGVKPIGEPTIEIGYHTATIDDIPEDTDVFHVLTRSVKTPQMIATKKFVYKIETDGTIRYLGTIKEVLGETKNTYKPII